LYLRDNARGIDPALRDRVFESGWRGSGDSPGYGLGLAYAQAIALRHGGALRLIESSPQGSLFVLALPVNQPEYAHD
jgi:signal transduction histidine kinase